MGNSPICKIRGLLPDLRRVAAAVNWRRHLNPSPIATLSSPSTVSAPHLIYLFSPLSLHAFLDHHRSATTSEAAPPPPSSILRDGQRRESIAAVLLFCYCDRALLPTAGFPILSSHRSDGNSPRPSSSPSPLFPNWTAALQPTAIVLPHLSSRDTQTTTHAPTHTAA